MDKERQKADTQLTQKNILLLRVQNLVIAVASLIPSWAFCGLSRRDFTDEKWDKYDGYETMLLK